MPFAKHGYDCLCRVGAQTYRQSSLRVRGEEAQAIRAAVALRQEKTKRLGGRALRRRNSSLRTRSSSGGHLEGRGAEISKDAGRVQAGSAATRGESDVGSHGSPSGTLQWAPNQPHSRESASANGSNTLSGSGDGDDKHRCRKRPAGPGSGTASSPSVQRAARWLYIVGVGFAASFVYDRVAVLLFQSPGLASGEGWEASSRPAPP